MSVPLNTTRALEILRQLIRIRTVQPYGDEKDAVGYILSLFPEESVEKLVVDHGDNRASLVLVVPGENRSRKIAVAGHLDTITVGERSLWSKAPFGAEFDGKRVYGRGAADMKGGLTSMILSARAWIDAERRPPADVLYCFTADEEVGGAGAKTLLGGGFLRGVEELLLVKPTGEKIGLAEKGALWLRARMTGKSSHAAMPEQGSDTIASFFALYEKIRHVFNGEKRHELLGHSSCVLTSIKGMDMPNVVPECVEGVMDVRTLPYVDHDAFLEKVSAIIARMKRTGLFQDCSVEVINNRPPVGMHSHSPLLKNLEEIYAERSLPWKTTGMNYFTDASILVPALGVPFAILGPGDEGFFHQPDEYVELDSVERIAGVLFDFTAQRKA